MRIGLPFDVTTSIAAMLAASALAIVTLVPTGSRAFTVQDRNPELSWSLVWSDEFDGAANTTVDSANWIYDVGTSYPGGPANWGTGEVEVMSADTANIHQDGFGHLVIKPIHSGATPTEGWTSGRIETQRQDFEPPTSGFMAVEASIQLPDVSGAAAAGYWPAFWMLGAPFRGNYQNWPGVGEIDIMEAVNGRNSLFATLHCGTLSAPNPCNEFSGLSSGEVPCPGCQTGFHTYRVEVDKSLTPQQIRWYLDGAQFHAVSSDRVDPTTWTNAIDHGFFIILNVAIGGAFPAAFGGGPTASTASGVPMLVDYVRVYIGPTAQLCVGDCDGGGEVTVDEIVKGVGIALGTLALKSCPLLDLDSSGTITVDELVVAVNNALIGC